MYIPRPYAVLRNSLDITPEEPDKGLVSGSRVPERGEHATQKRLPLLTMTSYHLLAPNSDVAEGGLMLGLIPNPRLRPAVELWGKHFGTLKKLKLQFIYFLGRALFVTSQSENTLQALVLSYHGSWE